MSKHPYHESVHLQNFTVFKDSEIEFSPGINAIIGENGSGKTHLLKAMYAYQRPRSREAPDIRAVLEQLFQTENVADLLRTQIRSGTILEVSGRYGDKDWAYAAQNTNNSGNGAGLSDSTGYGSGSGSGAGFGDGSGSGSGSGSGAGFGDGSGSGSGSGSGAGFGDGSGDGSGKFRAATVVKSGDVKMIQPVFIPAIDMMGHTKGFREAYSSVFLDFDLTCYDILNLFNMKSRDSSSGSDDGYVNRTLSKLLGGEIVDDETTGRFYLKTAAGRTEMPMVAEGLRKIASLVRLQDNNWLVPGSTLYWDEPEVNLNPVLMDELISSILAMSGLGIQVFLTTHSYVILKELDLQASEGDRVRFLALKPGKTGTTVTASDTLSGLEPNSILSHYGSLYDRDLDRALGKEPRRAKM